MTTVGSVPSVSPTLGINERVHALRAEGRQIHHFGFGEAPFPAPERLARALAEHATAKAYLPVAGLPELRRRVAEHQARLTGVDPERFDVLIGPGSKLLLFAIQMAVPGDLLLPVPSWVSYSPQAGLLGQRVIPVTAGLSERGYTLTPSSIERALGDARAAGHHPTKLLINFPNNPAGLTIDDAGLRQIAEVCHRERLTLISDEIYGRVSYDGRYRSAAAIDPDAALVTTGLSKHLSLGGWRLGVLLVPRAIPELFAKLSFIASETWSCVAAPVQIAALEAYAGHADIESLITDMTAIHACVNGSVATSLQASGVHCIAPQGGFYTYPDFSGPLAGAFDTSDALARALLEEEGIASLPGTAFGEAPHVLALRLAACDYDGGEALRRRAAGGAAAHDAAHLAPGVADGLQRFEAFVARHRRA